MDEIKPIGERLIVLPDKEVDQVGGIVIPKAHAEQPQEGTVVEIDQNNHDIKNGDKVIYLKHVGVEVTINEVNYLILNLEHILAVHK